MVAGWMGMNWGTEADEDRRWRQVEDACTHCGEGGSSSCEARAREWMRRMSQQTHALVKWERGRRVKVEDKVTPVQSGFK